MVVGIPGIGIFEEFGFRLEMKGFIHGIPWYTSLVVEPTHLKNMLVQLDHLPRVRGEHKKSLSCHHLVFWIFSCMLKCIHFGIAESILHSVEETHDGYMEI